MSLFSAQAATYYVATTGSDSNPGTSAQPFRTITYAYGLAGPGTTIIVEPGTYTDYQSGWGLHLGSSGTAANPIVLQSQVRGAAIIDGQNASDRNEGVYIDGNYNVLEGFEIKNGPNGGITIWGNGNQIINNEVDHNGSPASTSTNGRDGIYDDESTADNVYIGNYSHDNGRTGGSNLDHGMYICGSNDQIYNNVSVRNDGSGLQIAGYSTVNNLKVYNNVFAWNGTEGIIVWQAMNGVDIKNNISFHNGLYGIYFYAATGSGVVMDRNAIYGNGSGSYSSFSNGGGTVSVTQGTTISSDPMLANETQSGFDPHLNAGSPAIGAGYNFASIFTTDMADNTRSSSATWDLGAYAYGSSSSGGTPDTTPPTVSVTSPTSGATVIGTSVSLSANASDNVKVASVQFKLDGSNLGSAITASPYTLTWNSMTVANGSHTLSAVATDTSGNQATSTVTFTVNNPAPTVALTSPTSGASYSAPASINLTASITANGHTITKVQYYNGNTLLGTATTAPYSFTWNNVSAATYGVDALATYDSGSTVASPQITVTVTNITVSSSGSSLSFPATSGTISAPFVVTGNTIQQPAYTVLSASGQAVYTFNIPVAGNYVVSAQVLAPSTDYNSFWVNIDAQPKDPTMVWDVPVTTTLASQTVSWRGNGVVSSSSPSGLTAQYAPKVFSLSAGTHQLIVRGREGQTQLGTITIAPTTLPAN